jgi:hypothetical protein
LIVWIKSRHGTTRAVSLFSLLPFFPYSPSSLAESSQQYEREPWRCRIGW